MWNEQCDRFKIIIKENNEKNEIRILEVSRLFDCLFQNKRGNIIRILDKKKGIKLRETSPVIQGKIGRESLLLSYI